MARLNPGPILVLVVLFLIILNPTSQPASKAEIRRLKTAVSKERTALNVLNDSRYGDFAPQEPHGGKWLNLTGLRKGDRYAWKLLDPVRSRAREQLQQVTSRKGVKILDGDLNPSLLLYQNVTGSVRGRWVRSELAKDVVPPSLNLSALAPKVFYLNAQWSRNITGREGRVYIRLEEKDYNDDDEVNEVNDLTARVTIQDETSYADGWASKLHGIHYRKLGAVVLTTTSEKFPGIFALPHFALSHHEFNISKSRLLKSLNETIEDQELDFDEAPSNPWISVDVNEDVAPSSPMCEMIIYLQQHPIESPHFGADAASIQRSQANLAFLEDDLRFPSGGSHPHPPPLKMSMTVFSPDCGFVLESKDPRHYGPQEGQPLVGYKAEVRVKYTKNALMAFILVLLGQIWLLLYQIKTASTPSRRSRISFYTMAMLSLGSSFHSLIFLFVSSMMDSIFVLSFVTAFLAFMDGLFFAMKFLMEIWTVQEPERLEQQRRQRQREAESLPAGIAEAALGRESSERRNTLPLPATSGDTGATPIILPSDQDTAALDPSMTGTGRTQTFGAIYTRYCLLLLTIVFCCIWAASSWPLTLRTIFANLLAFVFVSLWIPQIYRNIVRNCRKALSRRFVVGQSILRLAPLAYFWGVESNVLFIETDTHMLLVFVGWLWIQIVILTAQEIVGPRFLVNDNWSWVPSAWDYHRVLREDEEGGTLPIGFGPTTAVNDETGPSTLGSGTAKPSQRGEKVFDCAICMQKIEVPVIPADGLGVAEAGGSSVLSPGFLARRAYMVTPCRHIFHSECLEGWIGYRLQCPICRESLPPL